MMNDDDLWFAKESSCFPVDDDGLLILDTRKVYTDLRDLEQEFLHYGLIVDKEWSWNEPWLWAILNPYGIVYAIEDVMDVFPLYDMDGCVMAFRVGKPPTKRNIDTAIIFFFTCRPWDSKKRAELKTILPRPSEMKNVYMPR
jgi:hypothetical protein